MLARILQSVAVLTAASLALVGIVFFPGLVVLWTVGAAVLGGMVWTWRHVRHPAPSDVRVGAAVAAATTALGLAVAGSIVLFVVAPVWAVAALLGLVGLIGWRYRLSVAAAFAALVTTTPAAARPAKPKSVGGSTRGPAVGDKRAAPPRSAPPRSTAPLLGRLPSLNPGTMSTTELCGTWQRSYWLLLDLPAGPSHDEVVRIRCHVLDELERRHPVGVRRWLNTEPRAGSHPGQYLIADM